MSTTRSSPHDIYRRAETAVMEDRERPCLYGIAPPCYHPKCLEVAFQEAVSARLEKEGLTWAITARIARNVVKRKTERERSRSLHLLRVTPAGGFVVPDRLLQGLQEGAGQTPPESDAAIDAAMEGGK